MPNPQENKTMGISFSINVYKRSPIWDCLAKCYKIKPILKIGTVLSSSTNYFIMVLFFLLTYHRQSSFLVNLPVLTWWLTLF